MSKVNQALKDLREDAKHHLDSHIDYLNERLDIIEEKLKEQKKYQNKLNQYKQIEEELGIDLITLFKLINAKNVYSYGHTSIMNNTGQVDIYNKTITIWNGYCYQTYQLSEYGKSYALTKEELK